MTRQDQPPLEVLHEKAREYVEGDRLSEARVGSLGSREDPREDRQCTRAFLPCKWKPLQDCLGEFLGRREVTLAAIDIHGALLLLPG